MSLLQAIGLSALPNLGGILGGLAMKNQIKNWYDVQIVKPKWRPPNWIFGPTWTALYTSMGYASYLVLRDGKGEQRNLALGLYASQLALNWAWSPIFFNYHKLGLATADILLLATNIAACIWAFYPINKTASYLMVPYLMWVSFASALTLNIWRNNTNKKDQKKPN